MKKLFFNKLKNIINSVQNLLKILNQKIEKFLIEDGDLSIVLDFTTYKEDFSHATFQFSNPQLLDIYSSLKEIFFIMQNHEIYGKLGSQLIIFIVVEAVDSQGNSVGYKSLHHQWLIDSQISFDEYFSHVSDRLTTMSDEHGYSLDIFLTFRVDIWSADQYKNKTVKIISNRKLSDVKESDEVRHNSTPLNSSFLGHREIHTTAIKYNSNIRTAPKPVKRLTISPLVRKPKSFKPVHAFDLETVDCNGIQVPVLITFFNGVSPEKSMAFPINERVYSNPSLLENYVSSMWDQFIDHIYDTCKDKTNIIFAHNLGSFDGYFLFKFLSHYYPECVTGIVDFDNKFITITFNYYDKTFIFKDSFRLFPVSLNDLAEIFGLKGKIDYNPIYNNLAVLADPEVRQLFISYGKSDSELLYNTIIRAQQFYFNRFHIDIADCFSLPSMSLKIFRTNYLRFDIPILKDSHDKFIRRSYFGGATDIYLQHATNVYYYDINSLYPFAMCKDMPYEFLGYLKRSQMSIMEKEGLGNFFGFLEVDVECPRDIIRPVLPTEDKGRTLFPTGKFTGVYFSEEIKAVIPLGYKILRIRAAMEFSRADLFSTYVKDMYEIKSTTTGAERWIAKLHLNSLYGIFGRRLESLQTLIINNNQLSDYLLTTVIKNIIPINNTHTLLLTMGNLSNKIASKLNLQIVEGSPKFKSPVKSNVAIASAITAWARIEMIKYKLDPYVIYSDTDSILTLGKISDHLLGTSLGLMKDEMNGKIIKELFVLGIKQYGFWYYDDNGTRVEKSVWAGYTRDGLSFNDIKELAAGNKLTRVVKSRFYRSINELSIRIKDITLTIQATPHKKLIDNVYQPIHINKLTYEDSFFKKILGYVTRISKLVKKIVS
uniref:DNA polymerase n=2 Tax=Ganoderma sichuanense TaxID=1173713 RepID=UPI001BEE7BEB|nr:DNA polymerase [Ganoderma sichuanense]QUA00738.1 DNA polymerase [Ganoderma sichuanense]